MLEDSASAVGPEEQREAVEPPEAVAGPIDKQLPWARWELVAFILIVVLALGLRMWDLGAKGFHHDESLHALYGWYIYDGREYRHDPMMHGPFQFFGYASIFWLLWDSDATARLLPALFGTALVAVPLLLRRHLGRAGTLATALLLALSPTMLYFSRFVRNDIYMAVWALLLVAFMWGYLDTRKRRYLVLSSVVLAFAFATKETTYILVAVLGSYLFIASVTDVVPWLLGRKRLRSFSPQGEVMVLMATLALPLGVAGIALFQHTLGITLANPDWAAGPVGMPKGTGLYVAFLAVVAAFIASVAVGLRWRPWVWLVCFGAFATVWVLLYSSFFTNFPGGLLSGLWQSLGYWVVQQDVARGGQPWYYYLVLGLNYEFLPLLVGTAAAAYYLVKGDRFSLFLVYWAIGSFVLYTYAAEKMPWLLVNVVLPFTLLTGKALGRLLEHQPWQHFSVFSVRVMEGTRRDWKGLVKAILDACYITHILLALVLLLLFGILAGVSFGRMADVDALVITVAAGRLIFYLLPWGLPGLFLSFFMWRRHRRVAVLSVLFTLLIVTMFLLVMAVGEVRYVPPAQYILPVSAALGLAYVLLAGYLSLVWFLGRRAYWVSWWSPWPAVGFTLMMALLIAVAGRWLILTLASESGVGPALRWVLVFLVLALIAACAYLLWHVEKRRRAALVGLSLAGVMLALSVQAAFRVTYANPDVPVEMLVYTQSAPDIPQLVAEIERLGKETGKGRDLKITVDGTDGFSWPWAWYLRNYKYVGYPCYSNESGCRDMEQPPEADVVLLAARNQASAEQFMSAYGTPVPYKHRWWFPESYRGITGKTVWESLRKRESVCRVVDYFLYRDFGLGVGSVDAYAYFPKSFTPTPVGRDVAGNKSRC